MTVQAPHNPAPQPNFAPVRPRSPRRTHSSMRSSSIVTLESLPLSVKEIVRSMQGIVALIIGPCPTQVDAQARRKLQ